MKGRGSGRISSGVGGESGKKVRKSDNRGKKDSNAGGNSDGSIKDGGFGRVDCGVGSDSGENVIKSDSGGKKDSGVSDGRDGSLERGNSGGKLRSDGNGSVKKGGSKK